MQVRSSIVGVPFRIEVVIWPNQSRVQRSLRHRLCCVDLTVIVSVLAREDLRATAEDPKAVDQTVLAANKVCIKGF